MHILSADSVVDRLRHDQPDLPLVTGMQGRQGILEALPARFAAMKYWFWSIQEQPGCTVRGIWVCACDVAADAVRGLRHDAVTPHGKA